MEQLLKTLNDLTPLLMIGSLATFMTLEKSLPYFEHGSARGRQRWRNLGMIGIAFVINALASGFVALPIIWSERNQFGLLHQLLGQSVPAILIGMLLIDLCNYALHVVLHKVPVLWRIHRVHHSDTELDATSGLRLHPLELLLQIGIQVLFLPLLGVSMASYIFYFTFALPWFVLNHSNLRFPAWFERYGSLILSTPDWHRIHHSSYQPDTDSHYGCLFSIWDRVFGTAKRSGTGQIKFGLEQLRDSKDQSIWNLLKSPFQKL